MANFRIPQFRKKLIWCLAVAAVSKAMMDILPDAVVEAVFMRPAAHIAALYWGAAVESAPLAFSSHGVTLEVTRECAATDFFSLVFALFTFALPMRAVALRGAAAVPLAWAASILTNAVRLAALVVTDRIFPAAHIPAVHLAVGIAVFLSAYVVLWNFLAVKLHPGKGET